MNRKRKLWWAVLGALLCVIILGENRQQVLAEGAVNIGMNRQIEDQLTEKSLKKDYSFCMDQNGYFYLQFDPKDFTNDPKGGWKITIRSAKNRNDVIYSEVVQSAVTSPKLAFKKGQFFYLEIVPGTKATDAPVNQPYLLKLVSKEAHDWEQESNDSVTEANKLTSNRGLWGNLYNAYDEDCYLYTVHAAGTQSVIFAPEDLSTNNKGGWDIDVYDADTNAFLWRWETAAKKTYVMDFKKGTGFVFRIRAKSLSTAPVGKNYNLKVVEKKTAAWEKENCITSKNWQEFTKNVTKMSLGKKSYGNLYLPTDEDLFCFTVKKDGLATLDFNPNELAENLGYGFCLSIKNKDGVELRKLDYLRGRQKEVMYLKKGTYYIHLYAMWGNDTKVGKNYTLSVSFKKYEPGKVTGVKLQGRKLCWRARKAVDGYQIQYAFAKHFRNSVKQEAVKNTVRLSERLKPATLYYVRVRAYKRMLNGKTVYGSWSEPVLMKTPH